MSGLSSPSGVKARSQQTLTSRYKAATENLHFSTLPKGTWLELTRVINKSAAKVRKMTLEAALQKNMSLEVIHTPPRTPRSITEKAFSSPSVSGKFFEKACLVESTEKSLNIKKNDIPMDCISHFHDFCTSISGSTSLDMFRIVLSSNPSLAKTKNKSGNLPLHVTLSHQEEPSALIVNDLLQAYPESASVRDGDGFMPLFLACKKMKVHPSIIKSILNSSPKSLTVKHFGSNSLHALTYTGSGHADAIKYLVGNDKNSSLASQVNNFNNLPLHYLVVSQSIYVTVESIRNLVNAYPRGVTQKNKLGETPLSRMIIRYNTIVSVQNENSFHVIEQGLRYMLRSVDYDMLHITEKTILKQLNWKARRDIVMCLAISNVSNLQILKKDNLYDTYDDHNKDDSKEVEEDSSSAVKIGSHNAVLDNSFAIILSSLGCEGLKHKIFSYL